MVARLRQAGRARAGCDHRRARRARPAGARGSRRCATPAELARVALRPRPRPALAADLLHATSPPPPRRLGGQRARGAADRRRAAGARAGRRTAAAADAREAVEPVAAGGDAGRSRGRDVRAPGARGDRLRRRRPRRRAGRADRRGAGAARGRRSATRRPWPPGCARRSRPRSGRCSAACACATSRAPTGSTSSASSCRWPAATSPRGWAELARIAAVLREHLADRRPAGRLRRRRLDDAALRQSVRGYLTGSLDLVIRLPATAGAALRRARLQDQLAGRARRAADRSALPPGGAGRRDAAPPLRAAGAALPGRAAPLPALARCPGYDPERDLAGVGLPVPARDDGRRRPVDRRRAVRRVRLAAARRAGRRRSATRWTPGGAERPSA